MDTHIKSWTARTTDVLKHFTMELSNGQLTGVLKLEVSGKMSQAEIDHFHNKLLNGLNYSIVESLEQEFIER